AGAGEATDVAAAADARADAGGRRGRAARGAARSRGGRISAAASAVRRREDAHRAEPPEVVADHHVHTAALIAGVLGTGAGHAHEPLVRTARGPEGGTARVAVAVVRQPPHDEGLGVHLVDGGAG